MKKHLSSLCFFITALLWGFSFVAQKQASVLPTFTVVAIRMFLAGSFLMLLIPFLDKLRNNDRKLFSRRGIDFTKTEIIGGISCGAVLILGSCIQQTGVGLSDNVGKAAFISALYVLIVPIIGLFVGKRAPLNVWIGVFIAIVGFYLLCIKDGFSVAPADLIVLVSTLFYALHIIVVAKFSPSCDGVRIACLQFFTGSAIAIPLALIFNGLPDPQDVINVIPMFIYFSVFSGGIAYTLQIIGQKDADPTVASIILSLESVFGTVGGAIFFHEKMELREYIGCIVVFVAIIIAQLDFKELFKKLGKEKPIDTKQE